MDKPQLPSAVVSRLRRLSLVWLIPIVALAAGAWMVYDNWSKQGPEIVLYMPTAEGIDAGKTAIKVLSVDIGKVTAVELDAASMRVRVLARLNASARDLLRADSQFWVVKPRIERGAVSGLSTLLSGAYIQLQPGKAQARRNEFTVLTEPPVTAPNVPGIRLTLTGRNVKALKVGDPVLFQNVDVGRVEKASFDPDQRQMNYLLFVQSPYDKLVTQNSRFWISSGIQLNLSADGIRLNTGSLESLMSGGVSFDVPNGQEPGERAVNMSGFVLYPDQSSAEERLYERRLSYVALFPDSVRGLKPGAPIEYRGVRVGTVGAVPWAVASLERQTTKGQGIPVQLFLEVGRLSSDAEGKPDAFWRNRVAELIRQGMVVKLKTGNLITGSLFVELDFTGKPQPLPSSIKGMPIIPAVGGSLAQIESKVVSLLDKLNALKLEDTIGDARASLQEIRSLATESRQLMGSLDSLAKQPEVTQLPAELQRSLTQLNTTLQSFDNRSQSYQELMQAISSLNQLMQEARPVVRTLNEQPSALLFDRSGSDTTPKGSPQ